MSKIGSVINGRYNLVEIIGQGGSGIVFGGHDLTLKRDVAIKLLNKANLDIAARRRMLDEAQLVAKLHHPNIITVHDAGEFDDSPFIVMQRIVGETLHDFNADDLETTLRITGQICDALEHAHQAGIIHRDLKPENVIIDDQNIPHLMDFGLARSVTSRLSSAGTITGTVFYMAPEQGMGQPLDARSDLYSLGVMLYELVTGSLPFEASDPVAIISQHIHAPVVPPRARREDLPPALNDLILNLMEKNPRDRPASAAAVKQRLAQPSILDTEAKGADEIHALERIVRGRIIGREIQIEQARSMWQETNHGEGQLMLISGEPGIGKTRLMREIRTHAEVTGGLTLLGECYSEGNPPYSAFAQIIRKGLSRTGRLDISLPEPVLADLLTLAPVLAHQYPDIVPNPKLDPETEQQRLFEHVVSYFKILAEQFPVMLVVEDAHWADEGSLQLLRHLVRRLRKSAVMIVVTYREVELRESRPFQVVLSDFNRERLGDRIKLTRLSRSQTRDMLAAIFAEEITLEFLDGIYQEAEGNPFFTEEICRALIEHGDLWFSDGQWDRPSIEEMQIPQGVQSAVESRLFRLPEECQTALQMAALLGREFEYEVLSHAVMLSEDVLIDAIETCERAQLIELSAENGATIFSFVHALVPAAIRESTHTLRRKKLHKKAAEAIANHQPNDLEALAYHYSEAGDEIKALEYYRRSAERALASYANQDAERLFRTALALEEAPVARADLLADLGMALHLQSKFTEAIEVWRQAIDMYLELGKSDAAAGLYGHTARAAWNSGQTRVGLETCREGLDAVAGGDEGPGYARLLAEYARACYFNGLAEESAAHSEKTLQLAEQLNLVDIQVESLVTMAILPDKSAEDGSNLLKKAVKLAEDNHLLREAARCYINLGITMLDMMDQEKSIAYWQRAIKIAQQIGSLEVELFVRNNIQISHLLRGDIKAAEEAFPSLASLEESFSLTAAQAAKLESFKAYEALSGYIELFKGNFEVGLKKTKDAIDEFRRSGNLQRLIISLYIYLSGCQFAGEYARGQDVYQEYLDLSESVIGSKVVHYSAAARFFAAAGDLKKADEYYQIALQAMAAGGTEREKMELAFANFMLSIAHEQWDQAQVLFGNFENVYIEHELYWHLSLSRMVWGTALKKQGNLAPSRDMLQKAQETFADIGADGFAALVQKELDSLPQ